jgi:hypothetical protein
VKLAKRTGSWGEPGERETLEGDRESLRSGEDEWPSISNVRPLCNVCWACTGIVKVLPSPVEKLKQSWRSED